MEKQCTLTLTETPESETEVPQEDGKESKVLKKPSSAAPKKTGRGKFILYLIYWY